MCGSLIELGLSGVVCVHIVRVVGIAAAALHEAPSWTCSTLCVHVLSVVH